MNKLKIFLLAVLLPFSSVFAQIEAVKQKNGVKNNQLKEAIIAYTMHYDIGYTDLAESVLYKYKTSMADEAIHSVNATSHLPLEKQFIWSTPGWPLHYMINHATPQRKAGLEAALKNKRFALQALAFDVQTESSDLENMVRNMNFSSALSKKYQLPLPLEAKMSDVPEHSWALPTVLSQAGVKILHLGCNPGSVSPDIPRLFWWEGPDGSRLLTFYWDQYYGSDLMPPADWPYKTWMAMISTHENTGPPKPEDVAKMLEDAKQKLPGVKVRIGTMTDFYNAIMKENPNIPVIRGDMPDTWIHGFMSMPKTVKKSKQYQHTIYEAEALHSLQKIWNAKPDVIQDDVNKAVEQMLLFEEHTFGLALSHGAGSAFSYGDDFILNNARGFYNRAEISWREKAAHIEEVERKGSMLQTNMLKSLAMATNINGSRVVVYNSLPWQRSGSVSLFMNIYKKDKNVVALKDLKTNQLIPVYNQGNLLQFYAEAIPAMGYNTYIPIFEGEKPTLNNGLILDEANRTIENKFLKITFDADKGTIVSCTDKQTGNELVDTSSEYGLGEYFHEYFGKDELDRYNQAYVKPGAHEWADNEMGRPMDNFNLKYQKTHPQKGRWIFQKNNDEISATYFGQLSIHFPHNYSVTYIIKPQTARIELVWNIRGKQAEANPEAGWIALPFKIAAPTFHLARLGGIINPSKDIIPRTNFDYMFLNTGMALTDAKGFGIGINTPDAPGVSLGNPGLYQFTKTYQAKKPTVFVNLYNTQWGTNFTEWINDSWSARIYLWPIQNYNNESGLITPMEETRQPLLSYYTEGPPGTLPTNAQGIRVSKKGIKVTSFAPLANENTYRLRLWEMAGKSDTYEIELPQNQFKTATLCNLRDEILPNEKVIAIKNNKLTLSIKANQPISILLK